MTASIRPFARAAGICAALAALSVSARAEMSAEELAKISQNPAGNLVSVPFRNNTNVQFMFPK
ncbi:MAG: hypothetical protein ACREUW_21400 [Burkholderiales bacterium]